nr:putative ribonuclease H-like domain-containing protein [Tanacetum cinerariifolium]
MVTVFRIIRYLKGTSNLGVLFRPNGHLNIQIYTNADWLETKEPEDQPLDIFLWWEVTLFHGGVKNKRWLLYQVLKLIQRNNQGSCRSIMDKKTLVRSREDPPKDPPEVSMADNRTMAELLQAPTDGYEDAIVIPEIAANNFELKHGLINLVQN